MYSGYTKKTIDYFELIQSKTNLVYAMANEARKLGLDPVDQVEIPIALSMAEKVVSLISTIYPQLNGTGVVERILELEEQYGKLDPTVVFKIAEEVSEQKFCKFNSLIQAMDAGIRIGLGYITLGVVSSPIEGYTGIETGKTLEGKEYIIANFSGPIRSAGTTASCLVILLIDFLREKFGFAKYDPTEEEIKRVWAEIDDFHERVSNLQYKPTEEEALFLASRMPFQISGDPSEKIEVSNYKNLARVPTNFLRSGFCLVMAEGLAQKAAKGFRLYNVVKKNGIKATGFDWLPEYIELHEKRSNIKSTESSIPTYIRDLVAGRPVYGYPSCSGGFRFRYGRGRNTGFSAVGVHPATMGISDDFLAIGTQLKIEKPTKGCAIASCDSIEGPIIKLKNGSVKQMKTLEEARKIYHDVEEIIYLGDILFPISDVINRNATLIKPGYVEEWWYLELKEKNLELSKKINYHNLSLEDAIKISTENNIPLYPKYIYYWSQISKEEFLNLIDWIMCARFENKLIFPWTKKDEEKFSQGKRALEILGIPHEVIIENIIIDTNTSKSFLINLGIEPENFSSFDKSKYNLEKDVLSIINENSKFIIKDKAGEFIGSRMGRPEKAKLRAIPGSPNSLFVVGPEGGRMKTFQSACQIGKSTSNYPIYYCTNCSNETIFKKCENCGSLTKRKYYFKDIKEKSFDSKIEYSNVEGVPYAYRSIDINHFLDKAMENLNYSKQEMPNILKGLVVSYSGENINERIEKGILRAKYGLQVFRDGTIRMDATELPLVSFKPKEIGTSLSKLNELGYTEDIYGQPIINDEQIIELKPHDILIPSSSFSPNEKGEDVFINVCNFIDELLVKFYKMEPFYNVKKKEDLIGIMGVCMAPHNCAGVACRFIGFSNTLSLMASPYMHAAIRRDCDGDEAAIMLLGDVLLNFSKKFLPNRRGATQDAPLVMNVRIDAGEVDDQILDFEYLYEYPLELYTLAEKKEHSSKVNINTVKKILKKKEDPFINFGFTHDTTNFNEGVVCSSYKSLEDMGSKVLHQMELVDKIRASNAKDTAQLIIDKHFLRDIKGNLRKFSMQEFRCVNCNEIHRRPPLSGKCSVCGGKLIFTIHEGGIKKYLEPAIQLAKSYDLNPYIQQSLELVKEYIDSIFGKEKEKQSQLDGYF